MNLWFDVKYAWRLSLRSPGHTLLCIVVVALSVGLAVWTWTLAYSQAWTPLPFAGSEHWYSVQVTVPGDGGARPALDAYTYQELLGRSRSARHLGAFSAQSAVLSEGQASNSLRAVAISPSLLTALKVPPLAGRLFDAAEGQPGAAPVVILSFDAWQNYFAADPGVVGKQARIDGQPMRIVGVMPRSFYAFEDYALWFPLQPGNLSRPGDSTRTVIPLIDIEAGESANAVANEMKAVIDDINRSYPALFHAERRIALIPAHRTFTHQNLQIVATTSFVALTVLLLGCVNISLVFLARLLERSRELALRSALGASRPRILRQCLLETAVVVLLGLLLGYALADLGTRWAQTIDDFSRGVMATGRSSNVPGLRSVDFLVATMAATVLWLLSTLLPAWRVARQDAASVLAGSGTGVTGQSTARSAGMLVGLQVAVSCLVLMVCVNLVLAIDEAAGRPTGMNTARVVISTYPTVFDARYPGASERVRYWGQLTSAITSRMPGAEVAYATAPPSRPQGAPVAIENQEGRGNQGTSVLPVTAVSDNYFELLDLKLRAGRLFDNTDEAGALPVAVVDENTARRYWANDYQRGSLLGKRIQLDPAENGSWLTIVGIVSPVTRAYSRYTGVVYQPLRQAAPESFHLVAKLPTSLAGSRAALRAAAFAVDRDLPLHNLQPLDDYLAALGISYTAMVPLFIVVTAITLILAATGLYGLISRSVARRTQEVGVRRALGSTQWQVTAVFLRQGAVYLSIGAVGAALGIGLMSLITYSVPNILSRVAPATFGILVVMALVIFTASYLPTRRATSLEPGDALHYE